MYNNKNSIKRIKPQIADFLSKTYIILQVDAHEENHIRVYIKIYSTAELERTQPT